MKKENIYIDLSKCSEEQVRMLNQVTNGYIDQVSEFPLLFWDETEWNQTQKGDKLYTKGKTEILFPEFIKLFEGGETIKSDNTETLANALHQVENLEADKAELLEALEEAKSLIDCFVTNHDEIESLIQKMKQ